MHKLETLVFENGERLPILMEEDGMPHLYTTLWIVINKRGKSVSAIDGMLRAVKWLSEWEKLQGRCLISEFKEAHFLNDSDLASLKRHFKINQKQYSTRAKAKKSNVISLDGGLPKLESALMSVGTAHHYHQMTAVAEYLDFVAKAVNKHRNDVQVMNAIEKMTRDFKKLRPKGKSKKAKSDGKLNLPEGLLDEFMHVAHVDNFRNPFVNPVIRKRNHLMFLLLRELGIRRGELLSLMITRMDLNSSKPKLWVTRTHDEKIDSRKKQPLAKTLERELPLRVKTAQLIEDYILNERAATPNAKKHPFLFVTHRKCATQGQPLSLSAFDNNVVTAMKEVDPKFSIIHPHLFRHEYNVALSRKIDANNALVIAGDTTKKKIEEGEEAKIRMHLMGHSSEKSGDIYNKRHIKEKADEISLADQEEFAKELEDRKKRSEESE